MSSKRTTLAHAVAEVIEAVADVLAPVAVVERRLRVVAHLLLEGPGTAPGRPAPRRARPTPTVEFTDVDGAKADRALARLGVRRIR